MSDKEKRASPKWLEKLKNIKHIEIYIAVIFIIVLALIFMSNSGFKSSGSKTDKTSENLTVTEYIENVETNLEEILTNIEGVENVKVMITLNMSQAEVVDSKINLSKFPDIKGVIVTAKGVNDTSTRMKVLHAIEAVIEVTNGNIEILSSN